MGLPKLNQNEVFTYGLYKNWPEDERWEIINGVPYNISPGPRRIHQEISGELFATIHNFLKNHNCKVYDAPFDVRLPDYDETDDEVLTVRLLDETKKYQVPLIYDSKKVVEVNSLPGLKINLNEVFIDI